MGLGQRRPGSYRIVVSRGLQLQRLGVPGSLAAAPRGLGCLVRKGAGQLALAHRQRHPAARQQGRHDDRSRRPADRLLGMLEGRGALVVRRHPGEAGERRDQGLPVAAGTGKPDGLLVGGPGLVVLALPPVYLA